eukprot:TRINITY_DN12984_c0_g1_i1.p4 TRINITY_DN12984_c0_g1~~TRINITY_DN12984_c0_g1_i1.p4  ORF type:complete len:126 (+),score=49.37 TRINITY_DN12984_c0_g1_i1:39-416(+)
MWAALAAAAAAGAGRASADGCCWLKAACPPERRHALVGKHLMFVRGDGAGSELWNQDCFGADLYRDGVYQKHCRLDAAQCAARCRALDTCGVAMHNYHPGDGPPSDMPTLPPLPPRAEVTPTPRW